MIPTIIKPKKVRYSQDDVKDAVTGFAKVGFVNLMPGARVRVKEGTIRQPYFFLF